MEASGRLSSRIPIIAVSANARSGQVESVRHSHVSNALDSHQFCPVISADSTDAQCRDERIRQQTISDGGVAVQGRSSYRKATRSRAIEQ
jgi:hypothetical protein